MQHGKAGKAGWRPWKPGVDGTPEWTGSCRALVRGTLVLRTHPEIPDRAMEPFFVQPAARPPLRAWIVSQYLPRRVGFRRLATPRQWFLPRQGTSDFLHQPRQRQTGARVHGCECAAVQIHMAHSADACRGTGAVVWSELPTCFISDLAWQPPKEGKVWIFISHWLDFHYIVLTDPVSAHKMLNITGLRKRLPLSWLWGWGNRAGLAVVVLSV